MSTTVTETTTPTPGAKQTLMAQLKDLPRPYWMVNIMEMFERLAYYGVRTVIPIYIAQADEINGLHFTQTDKGIIFMWWAVVQSLVPMFTGGFADRYGYKKTIAFSIAVKMLGYFLMATQREFYPFLFGCLVLALGTATFKPGVQGTMCQALSKKNSSVGWGMFYMLVNIGGFLGPPVAHFMLGISWPAVFYGCMGIVSLNFLMLLTYKEVESGSALTSAQIDKGVHDAAMKLRGHQSLWSRFGYQIWFILRDSWEILKLTGKNVAQLRLALFILIMSGFWLMFNQLFDMLPNFIVDWVDSSRMVALLHLPHFVLQLNSDRGPQISQEWMINFNSGLIVLTVVFVSWLVARMRRVTSIMLGIIVSSVGLVLAGFTMYGSMCIFGILFFSVGEMLSSPKMNEYLGVIAPEGQKGLYMGYANIPLAIGWGYGSFMGGTVYDKLGDKANLAVQYLADKYQMLNIDRTVAFDKLKEVTGMDATQATSLLWGAYHPYKLWYQFAAIGIASAIGMFLYSRWVRKYEAADV